MTKQRLSRFRVVFPKPLLTHLFIFSACLFLILGNIGNLFAQGPPFAQPIIDPFGLTSPTGLMINTSVLLTDLDHDDTLEAFVSYVENNPPIFRPNDFEYYENTGSNESPAFVFESSYPFGIPRDTLNFPNLPSKFVDIDGDGLEELFFFANRLDNPVRMVENTGTSQVPDFNNPFIDNPYGITLPESDLEPGQFLDAVDVTFVDIDSDGDYDIFYSGYFWNTLNDEAVFFSYNEDPSGNGTNPQFGTPIKNPFGLTFPAGGLVHRVTFADMDCDGDLDLYLFRMVSGNFYFENTGSATFPDFSLAGIPDDSVVGAFFDGTLVDIGGDGDLDVIKGGPLGIGFFENISPEPDVSFSTDQDTIFQDTIGFTNTTTASGGSPDSCWWDFGDGNTSFEQNPVHVFGDTGKYEVCLTCWDECRNAQWCDSVIIESEPTTSLSNFLLDDDLRLYPNPANEFLELELKTRVPLGQIEIEILSHTGQRIITSQQKVDGTHWHQSIFLDDISKGVYLLKITADGKSLMRKFVRHQ